MSSNDIWLFGYGSLIWRPDFDFLERSVACVHGFSRRFWQGSHDHRGVPDAPGRVVTLVPDPGASTGGMAYRIASTVHAQTFAALDHREKNGYVRRELKLALCDGREVDGLTYYAAEGNFAWLGHAPVDAMAAQIREAEGPSGRNVDYLARLGAALREMGFEDSHVAELESAVGVAQMDA